MSQEKPSALFDAVYAVAWVSDLRATRSSGMSLDEALAKDHAKVARAIAYVAVAQSMRPLDAKDVTEELELLEACRRAVLKRCTHEGSLSRIRCTACGKELKS